MSPRDHANPPSEAGGLGRRALLRAQAHIEAHLGEPLRLGDIATAAHLSRSHFARAFRVSTGQSVMRYVCLLRMEQAKVLLIGSEHSIAEISAMLGFSHHSHFTRLFRREVGTTPRLFAHLHGAPPQK